MTNQAYNSTVATQQQTQKKGFLARAYHKAFTLGALRPHAHSILPHLDSPGGKFVEVGARDGLKGSLTPYLEKALGWKGLLIEPWPHLFQRCRKNRKSSVTLNVAASESLLRDSYIEIVGKPPATSVRRKLIEEAQARIQGRPIEPPIPGQAKPKRVQYVSTNSIAGILDRANFDKEFELIIFNLTGYEDRALDGMDFDRYKPTFLLVRTQSTNVNLPGLPHYYQKICSSKHDARSHLHLFRYSDFGVN
ncbi:hypothetical protein IEN85_20455 [Pelagicoccus sp. NFK12]|uniref:Methyltransferase FkbM domain-containing protein n=1 Tax=Pelagicoccus enzymogenes TaxID=2773457 RepID=A0A927FBN1_9BACT|nr:FkbM family methyltransferase [Pelagicoccus enzymogenes]MBD5781884.1 hypothetical protein [Pelagicoccus enzymogenes]